jgi:MFS family permease
MPCENRKMSFYLPSEFARIGMTLCIVIGLALGATLFWRWPIAEKLFTFGALIAIIAFSFGRMIRFDHVARAIVVENRWFYFLRGRVTSYDCTNVVDFSQISDDAGYFLRLVMHDGRKLYIHGTRANSFGQEMLLLCERRPTRSSVRRKIVRDIRERRKATQHDECRADSEPGGVTTE